MIAMGALSLRVDDRTVKRFRLINRAAPENPEFHRRRSGSLAMDDIASIVRGPFYYYHFHPVVFVN